MSHIHIPDGVLPLWLWGSGWVLTLLLVGIAGKYSERADVRRKVPLLAVASALMLVAMSSEIVPLAYHINLTVVGGVLLGPALSVIAAFVAVVVLAMLGHGGVTVLGLNTLMVAAEMVVGWALFRGLTRVLGRGRPRAAAAVATVVTLALTTTLLVGVVALAGGGIAGQRESGALDPATLRFENPFARGIFSAGLFSGGEDGDEEYGGDGGDAAAPVNTPRPEGLSVRRFAAVVYTLGPLGWLIEALVTAGILGYVARVRPNLLWEGALATSERRLPGHEHGAA